MARRTERPGAALAAKAAIDFTQEGTPSGYGRLVALQNGNVDAFMRLHMILRDGAIEWSNDLLDFTGRHFQQQLDRPSWQLDGAAPAEAIASHIRYLQTAAEQGLEQTARFLTLAAKLSRDSRTHLENHAAFILDHLGRDDGSFLAAHDADRRRGDQP